MMNIWYRPQKELSMKTLWLEGSWPGRPPRAAPQTSDEIRRRRVLGLRKALDGRRLILR
jgi:hypothetical protein